MHLHMTIGTIDYLQSLQEKNPHTSISARGTEAILYYEDKEESSIFSTKMTYEVTKSHGALDEELPLSVFYIPASGDGQYPLEGHLSDLADELNTMSGMISYRIGVSIHEEKYIVFIKWVNPDIFNDFKQTDVYEKYLTQGALKKFRNEESILVDSLSSKFYYNVEDNVYTEEEKEELND